MRRKIKHFFQRITRGWDDSETWSLYSTTAKFMLPRLKRFKELKGCHPFGISEDEWDNILDEIIWFLGIQAEFKIIEKEDYERYEKANELFGKYFLDLWW